jgi:hypothetical protein
MEPGANVAVDESVVDESGTAGGAASEALGGRSSGVNTGGREAPRDRLAATG